ncbi:TPA: hypothetical protein ACKPYM_000768 [Stenotrophomonas maltophilia]
MDNLQHHLAVAREPTNHSQLSTCTDLQIERLGLALAGSDRELDQAVDELTALKEEGMGDTQLWDSLLALAGHALRRRVEAEFTSVH